MSDLVLVGSLFIALFFFLGSGVWVGASLIGCAVVAMALFTSRPIGDSMAITIWGSLSSWTLTSLPLFIWMGEILYRTKISETLFKGLTPWMYRLPGGLLHVNITGSAVFAAISGSSAATVATVGKMSIPELKKRNYSERMIVGTLAGAGTLGLLIPPSVSLIIYAVTVNESIVKLFVAGIFPGLMLAGLFMGFVAIMSYFNKSGDTEDLSYSWADKLKALVSLTPVLALIICVIGSIYTGIATATEAAVLGVIGALVIALLQRSLDFICFRDSLMGAIKTSSMIAFILMGAHFLSLAMGFTGLPRHLAEGIGSLNLSPLMLIVLLTVFYIVLGCFLDGLSSIVLTMAVIEPLVRQAGFDMIWFGIYLMLVVEMAQITPPVGFNLFVLQSMTGHNMAFIARAAFPMFLIMIVAVFILVWQPEIATFLPSIMQ
ncbi:MAG: TRAP transporter large permease [Marinomonas sp.]